MKVITFHSFNMVVNYEFMKQNCYHNIELRYVITS